MEDLLAELLNVLTPPAATQKTQVNGFSASQQTAQKTAHKATEKMGQKTDRRAGQGRENLAASNGSSALMTVASLSDLAIDQRLKAARTLEMSADTSQDIAVESLLFDAGVAVPEELGHQAFGSQDGKVHAASFGPAESDVLQDLIALTDEQAEAVDMPLENIEQEAKEDIEAEVKADIEAEAEEDREAELDAYVMSAFDIGDFEADIHATEAFERDGHTAGDAGSSDFDPDDLEIDRLDLEALGFGAQDDADAYREAVDERLETADISIDELVNATEQNFLARWFNRLRGAKGAKPEGATAELSEPRLFETDYDYDPSSQREIPSELAADYDVEDDDNFYANQSLELGQELLPEPPPDLSVEDAVSDALSAIPSDAAQNDPPIPEAAALEPSDESFITADEVAARSPDEPLANEPPVDNLLADDLLADDLLADDLLADDLLADDLLADEPSDTVPTADLSEPLAFELDTFEPDALDGDDEDGFDEDSLLEPLGEKAWLSEANNANEALHVAAAAGDLSGVWAALAANASVNALGQAQRTALSAAIESGSVPVVKMLLEMCADPNLADVVNGSPVRYPLMAATDAAEAVRGELISLLLARGAEVNRTNAMGQTALMIAAERGYIDAMRRLIEANADLDAEDLLGQTALLRAKGFGHKGAIALLQESSMDRERAISFLKAVTQGNLAEVEQWLAAGLSANTHVARMSALTQAAAKGDVAIAQLLIDAGADIDYRFYETDPTPLFHAAYRGQLEMVTLLLEAGASPQPTPGYPIGALDYAEIGQQKADDAAAFEPIVALLATRAISTSRQ